MAVQSNGNWKQKCKMLTRTSIWFRASVLWARVVFIFISTVDHSILQLTIFYVFNSRRCHRRLIDFPFHFQFNRIRCWRVWTMHKNIGRAGKYRRWLRSTRHHLCENKRFFRCWAIWRAWFSGTCLFRKQYSECVWRWAECHHKNESHWIRRRVNLSFILFRRLRLNSGQLNEEEEVLQWLITQKTEDRIELITRQMLETMVEETQYLAVYFCKCFLWLANFHRRKLTMKQKASIKMYKCMQCKFVTCSNEGKEEKSVGKVCLHFEIMKRFVIYSAPFICNA